MAVAFPERVDAPRLFPVTPGKHVREESRAPLRLSLWCSILVAFPPLIFCQALRFPGGGGVPQLLADSALAQARGVGVGQGGLGERVWVLLSQVGVVLPSVGAGQEERVPGGLIASGSGRTGLACLSTLVACSRRVIPVRLLLRPVGSDGLLTVVCDGCRVFLVVGSLPAVAEAPVEKCC